MKKKFTLFALALLSVVAFAYQTTRASGEPTVLYSWESPDGTVVETGGTASYENGNDPTRLNYPQKGYYTMCLNGKKANIGDTDGTANAGYMLITLNEELAEGDEIAITAFTNKSSSSKSSAYVVFENGDAIDSGDYTDESNVGLETAGAPITKTITVAAGNAGSKTIKLTRGSTGTNLFITSILLPMLSSRTRHHPLVPKKVLKTRWSIVRNAVRNCRESNRTLKPLATIMESMRSFQKNQLVQNLAGNILLVCVVAIYKVTPKSLPLATTLVQMANASDVAKSILLLEEKVQVL